MSYMSGQDNVSRLIFILFKEVPKNDTLKVVSVDHFNSLLRKMEFLANKHSFPNLNAWG